MNLTNVRIMDAGPFRVAAFRAMGTEPESPAYEKLTVWAEPRGLLRDPSSHLLFGRNDPPPAPGSKEYGYVYMLTVPEGVDPGAGPEVMDLPRATYAVVRACLPEMNARWEALYSWAESAGYTVTGHGLELHLDRPDAVPPEEMLFDLWLPVQAKSMRG